MDAVEKTQWRILPMLTNARNLTLSDLRRTCGLRPNTSDRYFQNWLDRSPPLNEYEQQGLERLAANYRYLLQEDSPLEEVIKLVVLSPLLDLAGFYSPPFLPKTEVSTSLEIADEPEGNIVQGRIDVLILQDSFWLLVIESKPARIDVTAGIPQALTYLLSAPLDDEPYGAITNGREFIFLKLDRQDPAAPKYLQSIAYRLLDSTTERQQILQALQHIGSLGQIKDEKGND
jgi:predicted type IV restriction endonuclease